MIKLDIAVSSFLAHLLEVWVPDRVDVPGGLKCSHCSYVVLTASKNPRRCQSVSDALKQADKHDPWCDWRLQAEATDRLHQALMTDGSTITYEILEHVVPRVLYDHMLECTKKLRRRDENDNAS